MSGPGAHQVEIEVDGRRIRVSSDVSVAAALFTHGAGVFRVSVGGAPRAPLCGMGTCHECRVTIDGVAHRRSCLVTVREGMRVLTGFES